MRGMRLFLLISSVALMLLDTYCFNDETDRQALVELKSQISENKIDVLSSWNISFPLCKWKGVKCGRKHKRVTRLDLGGLQLGGVISPYVGNLSFLRSLDLSNNSFGGTIPSEVGNLFRLEYLNIFSNILVGGIPTGLSNCSRLLVLNLYSNHLQGIVPQELGSLSKLAGLYLGRNNLEGKLPASLGNLTSLLDFTIAHNHMEGEIPDDIARLTQMVRLDLGTNNFSGVVPPWIYNFSSLENLYLPFNRFSGTLNPDFGILLQNLQELNLGSNDFIGFIPTTLSNISALQKLGIDNNNLIGSIPSSLGKLHNLLRLYLGRNSLGSYSSGDLEFLVSLTNCTKLEILQIGFNRLGGDLPTSIMNLSTKLNNLELGGNFISGSIPHQIGNLISLRRLGLHINMLTGELPTSLGKLFRLEGLNLMSNKISGEIPDFIANLTRLDLLYLHNNSFEGTIPPSISNCTSLRDLWIGSNKLYGTIPQEIMQIKSLFELSISSNSLTGTLPEDVGKLENLVSLSVSHNKLSGKLPQSLENCLSMETLSLQGNYFYGAIPDLSRLKGVKRLDFSNNNLSGSIPTYLAHLQLLEYLNLSINSFEGNVPIEGKLQNATIVFVFGNKKLCGGIKELNLKSCSSCSKEASPTGSKHSSSLQKVVIGVSISIAFLLLMLLASVSLCWFKKKKKNQQTNNHAPSTLEVFHEKISYREIRNATHDFSSNNMIGSGSFGTVYKALFPTENNVVAVKVINMQRRGAAKSFLAECESLKDIRHRNLVKLLTACSSIDFQGNEFRALIYEFMPNGSLDGWLHREEVDAVLKPSRILTLVERLNIAIDVASVLDYLHVHCHEPIAHCDLKPSNVLLDDDLTAHVSDFGLARLLFKFDQESFLNQLSSASVKGTIGYAAPEYGMGGKPSIHGDVYSFGVLLLEMFTGKRPTNELFEGNFTLHKYTKLALPERVLDIADKSILHNGLRVGFPIVECLKLVLEVGLKCCEESPTNRLATSEAIKELISVREMFFPTRRTARH